MKPYSGTDAISVGYVCIHGVAGAEVGAAAVRRGR